MSVSITMIMIAIVIMIIMTVIFIVSFEQIAAESTYRQPFTRPGVPAGPQTKQGGCASPISWESAGTPRGGSGRPESTSPMAPPTA